MYQKKCEQKKKYSSEPEQFRSRKAQWVVQSKRASNSGRMVKAVIFDVFGTIVDWRTGVAQEVEKCIDVDALAFADAWRGRYQPALEEIRSGRRAYVGLDVLHQENLDKTLEEFGVAADREVLNRAWEKLPPWPDSVPGLRKVKERYAIAPCSNGSIAMMTWLAKFAELPWDAILGAEIAQTYKPELTVYRGSAAALGLDPSEVLMVAAHNSDLAAARQAGLKTCFLPRPTEHGPHQRTDLRPTQDWDFLVDDLHDLAAQLQCS